MPAEAGRQHTGHQRGDRRRALLQAVFHRQSRRPEQRHMMRFRKHLNLSHLPKLSGVGARPRSAGRQTRSSPPPQGSSLPGPRAQDDGDVGVSPHPVHSAGDLQAQEADSHPRPRRRATWVASSESQQNLLRGHLPPPGAFRLAKRSVSSGQLHLLQHPLQPTFNDSVPHEPTSAAAPQQRNMPRASSAGAAGRFSPLRSSDPGSSASSTAQ